MRFKVNNRVSKLIFLPSYVSKLTIADFWLFRLVRFFVLILSKSFFNQSQKKFWFVLTSVRIHQFTVRNAGLVRIIRPYDWSDSNQYESKDSHKVFGRASDGGWFKPVRGALTQSLWVRLIFWDDWMTLKWPFRGQMMQFLRWSFHENQSCVRN